MDISAEALHRDTGNTWTIVRKNLESNDFKVSQNGDVVISFATYQINLGGQYYMRVSLTCSEIEEIFHTSLRGPAEQRVDELEKEVERLKKENLRLTRQSQPLPLPPPPPTPAKNISVQFDSK